MAEGQEVVKLVDRSTSAQDTTAGIVFQQQSVKKCQAGHAGHAGQEEDLWKAWEEG